MRTSTIIIVLVSLFFIRCKSNSAENDFSGTYALQTKGEYAIDNDTLIVSSDHSNLNKYIIQNNSGFQKIRNGITMPKEFKKTSWVATWDQSRQILSETDLGRQITFKDSGRSLILKNSIYQKIK